MAELFTPVAAGSNPKIKITVTDKTGAPLDLSAFNGYAFSVFSKPEKPGVVFAKAPPPGSNWQDFADISDEATGVIYIVLPLSFTSSGKGNYYAEILTQSDDGSYEPIRKNAKGKEFISIEDSPTRKFPGF